MQVATYNAKRPKETLGKTEKKKKALRMEGADYQLELYYTAARKMTKSCLRNRGNVPFLAERRRKIRLD